MRIVDALVEVLKDDESLTYKEAYLKIKERNLYQFRAKDPEAAVNENYVVIVRDWTSLKLHRLSILGL